MRNKSEELCTGDENYCIFATENLKLTAHVRWEENREILQLKTICAHNSLTNGHAVEVDDVQPGSCEDISCVCIHCRNFLHAISMERKKSKNIHRFIVGYNFIYLINSFKIASTMTSQALLKTVLFSRKITNSYGTTYIKIGRFLRMDCSFDARFC